MEQSLTPKPDPIVLSKPESVVPMVEPKPAETSSSVGMTPTQRFKEFARKNKKLVIALSILGLALLIAIILIIFSYKPAGTIKNDQPTVSAPVETKVKPIVLSKKCQGENQDISAMVPSDWTCGKTTADVKDLSLDSSDIIISFPHDVQPYLACNIGNSNCDGEVIYNSSKVVNLRVYKVNGKITALVADIKIGDNSFVTNIRLTDINQTELTAEQKALILQILESVEVTPTSTDTTKKLDFTLDEVSGASTLTGSIVVDKSVTLVQKDKTTVSIADSKNTALVISSLTEWNAEKFQTADFIGSIPSIGNTYRVTLLLPDGIGTYYTVGSNLKLGSENCGPASFPGGFMPAPCGTYPLSSGYYFRCDSTKTSADSDIDFCDSVMQNLTFTVKNN
ncbi:MAG: hypothetical protein ACMG57_03450 [Candidatus Dojkabacteria bacterium]